jgi:hypothetical protein
MVNRIEMTELSKINFSFIKIKISLEARNGGDSSTLIVHKTKHYDSNDFNYWFECSSMASGIIKFDLTLDKGNPAEQIKFLRFHDARDKNLYFLWKQQPASSNEDTAEAKCGCSGGGCYFYSVFPTAENFEFFNLEKSITRTNKLYAESLFTPGSHILDSQPMMRTKYPREHYTYDRLGDDHDMVEAVESALTATGQRKNSRAKSYHRSAASVISEVYFNNDDDFFTASEDEEDEDDEEDETVSLNDEEDYMNRMTGGRDEKNASVHSVLSSSKHSYFSVRQQSGNVDGDRTLTRKFSRDSGNRANELENETKMDLNFDIRRPILDSSLPKYCYLKHLSRAYVQNWNTKCSYPCYEDYSDKNVRFLYRQQGINFSYDNIG